MVKISIFINEEDPPYYQLTFNKFIVVFVLNRKENQNFFYKRGFSSVRAKYAAQSSVLQFSKSSAFSAVSVYFSNTCVEQNISLIQHANLTRSSQIAAYDSSLHAVNSSDSIPLQNATSNATNRKVKSINSVDVRVMSIRQLQEEQNFFDRSAFGLLRKYKNENTTNPVMIGAMYGSKNPS